MAEKGAPDRNVAHVAARQHGVITATQLAIAGVGKDGITGRVRSGRLHRIHRGVYAVGHLSLSFEGRCMAAVLALNRKDEGCLDAAVSHRSAAALWGILRPQPGPIDVSVAVRNGRKRRAGITVHRPPSLGPDDVTRRAWIPLTRPIRTLRDLRRTASGQVHRAAARRAVDLQLVNPDQLLSEDELTRSELERRFLRLCRRHRIPVPAVNARVGRFEVDFLWRRERVIAETDGFRYHGDRSAFERDRVRDAEAQRLGYRVLRFSYSQVTRSPGEVAATLRVVLAAGPAA
jgi:very-short-patch-repair endonuclease